MEVEFKHFATKLQKMSNVKEAHCEIGIFTLMVDSGRLREAASSHLRGRDT